MHAAMASTINALKIINEFNPYKSSQDKTKFKLSKKSYRQHGNNVCCRL